MSRAERDSGEINATAEEVATSAPDDRPAAGSASGITVRCAGRTAVGQVRDHNEDNFVVANLATGQVQPRDEAFLDEIGDRGTIFAVCDGMGGAAAGEVASQMAVDILVEAMRRGGPPKNRDGLARRLVSAVEEAGRRIFDAAQRERSRRGMGTTATVAVLVDRVMFLAEVGDSRAYLLRKGELRQLTKDQSLVNQLIEAGHLTEDEAEAFEHSNIILQALGTSETVQVDLTFVELRRGDRLLVCSDGLSGLLHVDTLRSTLEELKDPAECSAKLIEYAETAGGHDNITVVVADFDGEGLPQPIEGEAFGYVQYPLPMSDHDSSAFVLGETVRVGRRQRVRDDDTPQGALSLPSPGTISESPTPPKARSIGPGTYLRWTMGAVIVLSLAGLIWIRVQAPPPEEAPSFQAIPGPAQSAPTRETDAAAVVNAPVPAPETTDVRVHTDIEHATLFVNGESKGTLSAEQARSIKLPPGAYRFEAQSAGSPMAQSVVTVKGDVPLEVFLRMPKGASDIVSAGGAHAAAPAAVPAPLETAPVAHPLGGAGRVGGTGRANKGAAAAPAVSAGGATSARPDRSRGGERSLASSRSRQRARARAGARSNASAVPPSPAPPPAARAADAAGEAPPAQAIPNNPF